MTDIFYIEVSELLARNLHTGIQRVVRQIARSIIVNSAELDISVIPVVAVGSKIYPLSPTGHANLVDPPAITYSLPTPSEQPLRKRLRPILLEMRMLYRNLQKLYVQSKLKGQYQPEPLTLNGSDYFVILGSFWGGSSVVDAARGIADTGARIVPVIYDLIPITHPQFCDIQNIRAFNACFTRLLPSLTGIVTISKYCVTEIDAYLAQQGRPIPAAHFYLGADIGSASKGASDHDQPWPDGLLADHPRIYTMVGTIEPRKGHAAVLDGFERLWAAGAPDRLLIIGKVGWAVDDLIARFATHPERGKRLFVVHTATDSMLGQAYDFSHAAIIASSVEGFGLPLVEALYRRLPVIASDIDVFREIGGDGVLYFRLGDADDLAAKVVAMSADPAPYRARARDFSWIDWDESARQLVASVRSVATRRLARAN